MAYRNQNYMTNRKIKEEVDKNQKDYVAPVEEETLITIKATFNVLNGGDPAEGATVKIGSTTKTVDNDGVAIFEDLPNEEATATITYNESTQTKTIVVDTPEQTFDVVFMTIQGSGETMIEEDGDL